MRYTNLLLILTLTLTLQHGLSAIAELLVHNTPIFIFFYLESQQCDICCFDTIALTVSFINCLQSKTNIHSLETGNSNALQLEAARDVAPVVLRFSYLAHNKFEVHQPIRSVTLCCDLDL